MKETAMRFTIREWTLATGVAIAALMAIAGLRFLLPAYDECRRLRAALESQVMEYARLQENLSYKQAVDNEYKSLDPRVRQTDSDQIVQSLFLRDIEATLRNYRSLMMVGARPGKVKREKTHVLYPVTIAISGTQADVLGFMADLTGGGNATGIGSCSIRGVQGGNVIECELSLKMIRLVPPAQPKETVQES